MTGPALCRHLAGWASRLNVPLRPCPCQREIGRHAGSGPAISRHYAGTRLPERGLPNPLSGIWLLWRGERLLSGKGNYLRQTEHLARMVDPTVALVGRPHDRGVASSPPPLAGNWNGNDTPQIERTTFGRTLGTWPPGVPSDGRRPLWSRWTKLNASPRPDRRCSSLASRRTATSRLAWRRTRRRGRGCRSSRPSFSTWHECDSSRPPHRRTRGP